MGYLLHILAALAAVAAAEAGMEPWIDAPALVVLLVPGPHLAARAARRLALAGRFRLASAAAAACAWFPPLGQLLAVGLGWHAAILRWSGVDAVLAEWLHPALLASLVPFAVLEVAAIDARARMAHGRSQDVAGQRRFHVRLLFTSALPLVLVCALAPVVGSAPVARVFLEEVGLVRAAATAGTLVAIALLLPFLLRWCWETGPLVGRDHPWQGPLLADVAESAGFRYRELRTWRTGYQVSNAAILGFLPAHRYVLFTDLLLAQLGPRELVAVFAHEVGHARRHHVAVFASWALGYFLAVDLLLDLVAAPDAALDLALFAGLLGLGAMGFVHLSRRFELEADLESLELTEDPASLASALETVGGPHAHKRRSWRHFSVAERVAFLERATADPDVGRRLRRHLRRLRALGAGLLVLCVGLQLTALARDLPDDRLWAALRLGRFEEASAAAAGRDDVDPELAALVDRGAECGPEGDDEGRFWVRAALRALAEGDERAAQAYVRLAVLRGQDRLHAVLDALGSGPPEGADAAWTEVLEDAGAGGAGYP